MTKRVSANTNGILMELLVGVLASLVAAFIFTALTRATVRTLRSFPHGIRFLKPDRQAYTARIASLLREHTHCLFFKGLTGYDLFSSELIRSALEQKHIEHWENFILLLTSSRSPAFHAEPNPYYTATRLAALQKIVVDFVRERVLSRAKETRGSIKGIFYVHEHNTLLNILVLDTEAFFFIRGFTRAEGPSGQIIVNVDLLRCPPLVRDFVAHLRQHYIDRVNAIQGSASTTI